MDDELRALIDEARQLLSKGKIAEAKVKRKEAERLKGRSNPAYLNSNTLVHKDKTSHEQE